MESEKKSLEAALLDQRMRADKHKTNFEALKAQHLNLQEAHQSLQLEHEILSENYDRLRHKSEEIIQTLQQERDGKILECEQLRTQVLTTQKLEQLKMQLSEEVEEPYRKRMDELESDMEALRSEYNKLRYTYTFLKSEYEAATVSHQSVVEEMKAKCEVEVSAYLQERKELLSRLERDVPTELQRSRQLQRENSQLQQRVKGLLSENEELQAKKEHAGVRSEQTYLHQSRQLVELQALSRTLEIERSSLSEQVQSLQEELGAAREEQHSLHQQVEQGRREAGTLRRKLEEVEQKHQMSISEVKMEHLHHCRELEAAVERSVAEQQACRGQLEALQKTLVDQQALLANKERDLEQRVAAARGKEWEKQAALQREKIELEERLAGLQRAQADGAEESRQRVEQLEDRMRETQTHKSMKESEVAALKKQLEDKSEQLHSLQMELQQLSGVNNKYHALQAEHRSWQQSERSLRSTCEKLQEALQVVEEQASRAQGELLRQQEEHQATVERKRQSWCEEREALRAKVEEGQAHQQALKDELAESKGSRKKLQKHYKKQVLELKQSLDVLRAKEEQLSTEKEALRKAMNLENQKLRRKFTETFELPPSITKLQRKQKEFLFMLHSDPYSSGVGGGSHTVPASLKALLEQEKQHQHSLEDVNQRLDELSMKQEQLHSAAVVSTRATLLSPTESQHSISDKDI